MEQQDECVDDMLVGLDNLKVRGRLIHHLIHRLGVQVRSGLHPCAGGNRIPNHTCLPHLQTASEAINDEIDDQDKELKAMGEVSPCHLTCASCHCY